MLFEVFVGGLTATMSVTADDRAFPVSFGWHPWFRKPAQLTFAPTAMYRRDDDHIAVDELVGVTDGPWDDCFVNTRPVELHYDRDRAATVRVESACDHWVVFDMPAGAMGIRIAPSRVCVVTCAGAGAAPRRRPVLLLPLPCGVALPHPPRAGW